MEIITIDLATISTVSELYDVLAALPQFPSYFGKNLDAVYDVLTSVDAKLEIDGSYCTSDEIGAFLPSLLKVLEYAAKDNPSFTFEILDEPSSEEE